MAPGGPKGSGAVSDSISRNRDIVVSRDQIVSVNARSQYSNAMHLRAVSTMACSTLKISTRKN